MAKIMQVCVKCLISLMFFSLAINAFAVETLFYTLRDVPFDKGACDPAAKSLLENKKAIDVLVSQAYQIEGDGTIKGALNPTLIQYVHENNMKIYALVTNAGFDQDKIHKFLSDKNAQQKALATLTDNCKANNLTGYQFDLENIHVTNKDLLTQFIKTAADTLPKNGCTISMAIFPRISDEPGDTEFLKRKFENWSGVYDYKALAEHTEFLSIMAYDQHTGSTPPGPVAGHNWVESIIQYALKYVPAEKLSLGVPTYAAHWYTGQVSKGIKSIEEPLSFQDMQGLIDKHDAELLWDDRQKVPYTFYSNDELNEYIFGENSKSFHAKLELAKKYKLRGISVWRVGTEDPKIWPIVSQD